MTEEDILGQIRQVEDDLAVEKITYNQHHIWPVLKDRLFFDALFKPVKERNAFPKKVPEVRRSSYISNLMSSLYASVKGLGELRSGIDKVVKHYYTTSSKYIFLDGANSIYIDSIDAKKYSRYLSPYVEYVDKLEGATLLNFTEEPEMDNKFFPSQYLNIKNYKLFYNLGNRVRRKIYRGRDTHYGLEELNNKLKEISFPITIDITLIGYLLSEIEMYLNIYRRLFKRIRPEALLIECFYGNPNYLGATLAAKETGIRVIDIQHGVSFDPMYLGWTRAPENGYALLPDNYWVWSSYDVENVAASRGNAKNLKPLLGGNLWYKKYLDKKEPQDDDKFLADLRIHFKKTILVTLDHSGPLYECVLDAIRESPADWLWLIRFHPHDYRDPGYREKYIVRFKEFSNVHYEKSTSCNLYNLLNLVDFNVSRYSSVCIEALTFKVPSVIIMCDQKIEQLDIFEKNKCFYYSSEGSEIVAVLEENRIAVDERNYDFFRMRYEDAQIKLALNI